MGVSSEELCPFLEPRANWTQIQVDFEWTSEGTDEYLGHAAVNVLRLKSPDRCLVKTQSSLEPVDGNEVRDERGTTRSRPTLPRMAGVRGHLYHWTTEGLIGVRRRSSWCYFGTFNERNERARESIAPDQFPPLLDPIPVTIPIQ